MPRPNRGPYLKPNRHGYYDIIHYEHGKPRPLSTGTRDPAAAQTALAQYILGDKIVQEGGWVVGDAWRVYWTEHVLPNVVDQDRIGYCWKQLEPHFSTKVVQRLSPDDISNYTQKRLMWVQNPTVRRELSQLIACMNHLVTTKRLTAKDLPYVALPPNNDPNDRWLTAEEIQHLYATAEARAIRYHGNSQKPLRLSRAQRFAHIALQAAPRKRAIERLTWDRVHFGRGLIDFNYPGPRTKKRRPIVPISDQLRPILERAFAERIDDNPYVLDHSGSIRKAFERLVAEAKLADVTRHTLRHTWATHASMNGVPLNDIARVLGNSLAMVTKVYAHHQPEYLRSAVNFKPRSYATEQAA